MRVSGQHGAGQAALQHGDGGGVPVRVAGVGAEPRQPGEHRGQQVLEATHRHVGVQLATGRRVGGEPTEEVGAGGVRLAEELAQLRQTVSQRDSEVDSLVLDAAIESALGKAGAKSVSALVPFIRQSCRVVRDSKTHKPIGKVMQEDGKSPRVSKKQGSTNDMTIEEYVESLKGADEYSSFFNGSQASGTGAAAGAGADRNSVV